MEQEVEKCFHQTTLPWDLCGHLLKKLLSLEFLIFPKIYQFKGDGFAITKSESLVKANGFPGPMSRHLHSGSPISDINGLPSSANLKKSRLRLSALYITCKEKKERIEQCIYLLACTFVLSI